jgi:hypothetical protein
MSNIIPRETLDSINDLRGRILAGEEIPQAELAAALTKYRSFREHKATAAQVAKEEKAVKKAGAALPPDLLNLLGEL